MKPSITGLRPLGAGEILDQAFRLYRANFWSFVSATAILLVPLLFVEVVVQYFFQNAIWIFIFELFLVGNILNGAMVFVVSQTYLGRNFSLRDAYGRALGRFVRIVYANVHWVFMSILASCMIFALYILLIALIFFVFLMFRIGTDATILFPYLTLLFLFLIPFVGYAVGSARLGVIIPIVLLENSDVKSAASRSWLLTSKYFWRIFVVMAASTILSVQLVLLPGTLLNYLMGYFAIASPIGSFMLPLMLIQLGHIISIPLNVSIVVILYYDLRIRLEGYDIELALQVPILDLQIPKQDGANA